MSNHVKIVMNDIILAREVLDMDLLQVFTAIISVSGINVRQLVARASSDQQLKWQHGH